jgi:HJR/Mrr/RecB family endonuclease
MSQVQQLDLIIDAMRTKAAEENRPAKGFPLKDLKKTIEIVVRKDQKIVGSQALVTTEEMIVQTTEDRTAHAMIADLKGPTNEDLTTQETNAELKDQTSEDLITQETSDELKDQMSADLTTQEMIAELKDQTTLVLVTESGKTNKKEETILEESQKAKEVQTTENVLY